jgi:hypothetical protein
VNSDSVWSIDPAGGLKFRAMVNRVRNFFTARVSPNFAMRGKVLLTEKQPLTIRTAGFGIAFDRTNLGEGRSTRAALTMEVRPSKVDAGMVALVLNGRSISRPVKVDLREENDFEFTRDGAKLSLVWNGKKVAATLPAGYEAPRDPSVGLGWQGLNTGGFTIVKRLEIRNLNPSL